MRRFLIITLALINTTFAIENSISNECIATEALYKYQTKFTDKQKEEIHETLQYPCKLRIMTYNVLSKDYDHMQLLENRWASRKERVIELIKHDAPDIICFQELTVDQIEDLSQDLKDMYDYFAPYPNQYRTEMLGIFYNKGFLEVLSGEKKELGPMYYWETFQAMCFQYFIKVTFKDIITGKTFTIYNTHLDYLKPNVRQQLLDLVLNDAEKDAMTQPVIIAGDFNTLPSVLPDNFRLPVTPGLDGNYILYSLTKRGFRNSLDLALIAHAGPMCSFTYSTKNCMPFSEPDIAGLILDHIFVTPESIKVLFHAIDPATVGGHFPSDHLPVFADIAIK